MRVKIAAIRSEGRGRRTVTSCVPKVPQSICLGLSDHSQAQLDLNTAYSKSAHKPSLALNINQGPS
jgi:hypothetical protein